MSNTIGGSNVAIGYFGGEFLTTGTNNIAVGANAGFNLTTGSSNIDIGNMGVAAEANTIRIGTQGTQTAVAIAGIWGAHLTSGTPVVVGADGRLGILASSARYKRDIHDMGDASDKLMRLQPVSFRYKADPTGAQQYGLIAEEVAKVYPELVVSDADGKPETVAYDLLPAMLLNEAQKQSRELAHKDAQISAQQREIAAQQQQLNALQQKVVQIGALSQRLDALELQARAAHPDQVAAATR